MMNLYKLKDWTFHNSKNFIDIHILVCEKFLIPWYQIVHNISTWKIFHGFITWIDILVLKPNKKIDKYRYWKLNEAYKATIIFLNHNETS
jgi:hypothetical protein